MTQLFTRKQNCVLVCRFVKLDDLNHEVSFRPDQPEVLRSFLDELAASASPDLYVNVVNERAKVFFKTPIKGLRDGRLVLAYPQGVFRVQRREHIRYKIPQGRSMRVEVHSPLQPAEPLNPKVVDFSAGGMAFCVPKEQENLFSSGQLIPTLRFSLDRQVIFVQGHIRHVRRSLIEGVEMAVVGVLFVAIEEADRRRIADFVARQHRAILSRLL